VERLTGVRKLVMDHLQNLDDVLAYVERAGATISGETSDLCWNTVKIVGFVCGEAGWWPHASKVDKVWKWPWCKHSAKCRAFLELCTYYRILIPEYAIGADPLFGISRRTSNFTGRLRI
jgi:hypothetical protein